MVRLDGNNNDVEGSWSKTPTFVPPNALILAVVLKFNALKVVLDWPKWIKEIKITWSIINYVLMDNDKIRLLF